MKTIVGILVTSLLFFSCGQTKKIDNQLPAATPGSSDTSFIAVLSFNSITTPLFKGAKAAELSGNDFVLIDSLLTQCVAKYNKEQTTGNKYSNPEKAFLIDLSTHKRQYVAMVNEKGEKLVWVNCFCNTWDKNWKKELISVLDGGVCYFNLKINLATNSCYELVVNGIG